MGMHVRRCFGPQHAACMRCVRPVVMLGCTHRYCGIHSAASVVKCVKSGKWFCNGRVTGTAACIVTHLVGRRARGMRLPALPGAVRHRLASRR